MVLINRPGYPEFIGFGSSIDGEASIKHVEFCKDFERALSAPVTEILLLTIEEGKTGEDLDRPLQTLAEGIDKASSKYAPAAWGVTLESSREYYTLVGWESVKVSEIKVNFDLILVDFASGDRLISML